MQQKLISSAGILRVFAARRLAPLMLLAAVSSASADVYLSRSSSSTLYDYTTAGTLVSSRATGGNLNALSLDATGNLYVTDLNSGVLKVPAGQPLNSAAFTTLSTTGTAADYFGNAVDSSGNVYVTTDADNTNSSDIKVFKYTAGAGTPTLFSDTAANTSFSVQNTIAVDPVTGNVFVADSYNGTVLEYGPSGGSSILSFTNGINTPRDIAVDALGNLYVANNNGSIEKIGIATGTPTLVASNLISLTGIAVDRLNNLYYVATDPASQAGIFEVTAAGSNLGELFNTGSVEANFIAVTVPEPATAAIAAFGIAGVMLRRRR